MVRAVPAAGGRDRMGVGCSSQMSEGGPSDPLARLGDRLARARRGRDDGQAPRGDVTSSRSELGLGFRIGIELVAALCVGLALGWVTDRLLGTRPWGLIAFFFLGAGAGTLNVFRAAQAVGRQASGRKQD
jgi:ATP synthase protein I